MQTIPEWRSRSRANAGRHLLLGAGLPFGGDGALETVALLQPGPISRYIGPKILGKPNIVGQPERIADRDVGGGEAAGA